MDHNKVQFIGAGLTAAILEGEQLIQFKISPVAECHLYTLTGSPPWKLPQDRLQRAQEGYLIMVLLLLACAKNSEIAGTWLFTRTLTAPTGEECISNDIRHNFSDSYVPEPVEDTEDPWTSSTEADESAELFFGRVEEKTDGVVLIIGNTAYPATASETGAYDFSWTRSSSDYSESAHASGYLLSSSNDVSSKEHITGSFADGSFTGQYKLDTTSDAQWTESDTWSDEVVATIGSIGLIPVSSYLVHLDSSSTEVASSNDYATFDCEDSDCTLAVSTACNYAYAMTGVLTNFGPDDEGWVGDAGQAAGTP